MKVVPTIAELRAVLRARGSSVGFVPTMGALHAGHARLLHVARPENDALVASIFVNPLQFDRPDDLAKYPRTLEADLAICDAEGVDYVFTPTAAELYPQEQLTFVDVPALSGNLCGEFRPGHFRGVCTVVSKLFHIVQPDRAYFGEKDAQQLAVIRRMTRDLSFPIAVVGVPTVREADGLAMSSRNRHLAPQERCAAPRIYATLQTLVSRIEGGERVVARLKTVALAELADLRVEYFEVVDPETLAPLQEVRDRALIAAAVWIGSTRLIDNVSWRSS